MQFSSLLGFVALPLLFAASGHEKDERTIRSMLDQAISRLNKGDVTAFKDFGASMRITLALTAS